VVIVWAENGKVFHILGSIWGFYGNDLGFLFFINSSKFEKISVITESYIDGEVWHKNCHFYIKHKYVQIPVMAILPSTGKGEE